MMIRDKTIVVTGGGRGIGEALCRGFSREGAGALVIADIDEGNACRVAEAVDGLGIRIDVSKEEDMIRLVKETESRFGKIDLFCSNAGIFYLDPSTVSSTPNEKWQRIWEINVMAHVYAARAALPAMIARGGGYFLITASAAGLLAQIGSAPYTVTKHAAVGFAESLAIAHGGEGIGVSVLCPQAVRTAMVEGLGGPGVAGVDGMMEPDALADSVIEGLAGERFLILPHPEVANYFQRKAGDHDRWLRGMRRLKDWFGDPSPGGN